MFDMTAYEAVQYAPDVLQVPLVLIIAVSAIILAFSKILSYLIDGSKWAMKRTIKSFLNTSDKELQPIASAVNSLPQIINSLEDTTKKIDQLCTNFEESERNNNATIITILAGNLNKCYIELIKQAPMDRLLLGSFIEQYNAYVKRGGNGMIELLKKEIDIRMEKELKGV